MWHTLPVPDKFVEWGKLPLHAIAARDIQKCLTALKARASAGTYNKYYSLINRMFNLACQWEYLESNPCKFIKKLKEAGCRMRYLNNAEIKSLLSALDAYEKSPSADAVRYLLYTGFRMSEALKLSWKDVDLDAGTVFLSDTKSGESRTAVMNALARQMLVDIKSRGGNSSYVFPGKYGKGRLMSPKRVFEAVKKAAGIEDFTIHCLRHTFASLAINKCASLYGVKHLLGHHSITMTERYAHLADKGLRAATDTVAEQIGQAVK